MIGSIIGFLDDNKGYFLDGTIFLWCFLCVFVLIFGENVEKY